MSTAGADIHKLAREGQSGLARVALQDNPTLLLSRDSDARTPLQNSISAAPPSSTLVSTLLDFLPQLESDSDRTKALENQDETGNTALISAAAAGNLEIVSLIVGAGASVTASNNKGLTALHYAASKGHVSVGQLLIQKGADINIRDKANQIPLLDISTSQNGKLLPLLRHRAATTGALPFIRLILSSESPTKPRAPRLNAQDREGNTPLHLAIESGHAESAVALIEAGADRDRLNRDGWRPEDPQFEGVGGIEAKRVREYIVQRCGPLEG
ncbi:putative ankyrin-repeat protein [Microbotryomycetes sp. JL221]|nr:putative ankyrin-repeat protein [Microbotryomycetes sp. JL221]